MAATANLNIRVGADARKFRRGMANVKSIIAGVVAALAAVRFGKIAVEGAVEFEKRLLEIDTIARQGKKGIEIFKKGILDLGMEIGATTEELTGGLYDALSAGVPNEKALSFLKVASKAAIAGVTDTKTAVNGLVSIMNAYSLKAEEVDRISDGFFTTIRLGKTTFPELSESIGNVASIAAQAGVSFEELMSSVATLTKAGLKTDISVTSLKAAMVKLIKPVGITKDLLKDMGFETGRAAIAQLGFQGTMQGLAKAAQDQGLEVSEVFTNVRALNAIFNVTGDRMEGATKDFKAFSTELKSGAKAFEVFEGSATQRMNQFKATIEAFTLSMGELAFPVIQNPENLEHFTEWLEGLGIAITFVAESLGNLFQTFDKLNTVLGDFFGSSFAGGDIKEDVFGQAITKKQIAEAQKLRKLGGGQASDSTIFTDIQERVSRGKNLGEGAHEQAISPQKLEVLRGLRAKGFSVGDIGLKDISGTTKRTEELLGKGVSLLETLVVE